MALSVIHGLPLDEHDPGPSNDEFADLDVVHAVGRGEPISDGEQIVDELAWTELDGERRRRPPG
jgi:hypothetical protein